MAKNVNPADRSSVAAARLAELLDNLAEQGSSQSAVARALGVPPQYLSDVRTQRRPMSELFARRMSEQFHVDYQWLMGVHDAPARPVFRRAVGLGERVALPLLEVPVAGEPRADRHWQGAVFELAGIAAAKAGQAVQPYVLRFGHDDRGGRLKKGDLVLITQSPSEKSELSVVEHGKKLVLARMQGGQWIRAGTAAQLGSECKVVGHCVGVVWSAMT